MRGQARATLPAVVLLTDDVANRQKSEAEGIACASGASVSDPRTSARLMGYEFFSEEIRRGREGRDAATRPSLSHECRGRGRPPWPAGSALSRGAVFAQLTSVSRCLPLARSVPDQYLPSATLSAGIKAGALYQGYFNASAYNYLEVCFHLRLFCLATCYLLPVAR